MQGGSSAEGGKGSEQLSKRKRGPDAAAGAVGPDAAAGAVAPDTEPQPKKKKEKKRGKTGKAAKRRWNAKRKQNEIAGKEQTADT